MDHMKPARLCVTLVHGTWGENASFREASSTFQAMLRAHFDDRIEIIDFPWSGKNSQQMRLRAANDFAIWFLELVKDRPESLHFVIAHSHGGNVAIWGLRNRQLRARVAGVVCMGTPFIHANLRRFWPVSVSYGLLAAAALNLALGAGADWIGKETLAEFLPMLDTLGNLSVAALSIRFAKHKIAGPFTVPLFLFGLSVFVFSWFSISRGNHSEALAIFANSVPGEMYLMVLSFARDLVLVCYLLLLPAYSVFSLVQSRASRLRRPFSLAYPRMHFGGLHLLSVPVQGDEALLLLTIIRLLSGVPRLISHWSVVCGFLVIQAGMSVYGGIAVWRLFQATESLPAGWLGWVFAINASVLYAILGLSLTGALIAVLFPFAMTWYCFARLHPFAFGIERPSLSLVGSVRCKDQPQGIRRSAEFRIEPFGLRACMSGLGIRGLWALRHSWMYASPVAIDRIINWMERIASKAPLEKFPLCDIEIVAPYSEQRTSALDFTMWIFAILELGVIAFFFVRS